MIFLLYVWALFCGDGKHMSLHNPLEATLHIKHIIEVTCH